MQINQSPENSKTLTQSTETPLKITPKKLNWTNASFLTALPIVTVTSLVLYIYFQGVAWSDVLIMLGMYTLIGLAVTAGYHRYYSHRAFDCHPIVQFLFLIFGAAALENSALAWVSDHRIHHRYTDREQDPYNINKGFFWAHIGWIFFDHTKGRTYENVNDLKKSKLVMFQNRHYILIATLVGFGLPTLIGSFFGRPIGGLIWGGLLRQLLVHHSTFLINSAAHFFGKRPYSTHNTARDSWWLAFLSFGEGYHNFHHAFPSDYRNGVRWYQWDPTKWLIRTLALVRLSWDLRRTPRQVINDAANKSQMPFQEVSETP